MTKTPTILEQFRSFYAQNSFNDLEHAVDYFMVFGGLNEPIDIEVDLFDLIEEHILDEYTHLNNKIANITNRDGFNNALLSGIATGDGRFHSVYKKARTTQNEAEEVLEELCD
ncbi:MAG: ATPase, partial [Campylobacterota bacterium]|nr:ATPase [Campylobacterota bacterium]